MPNSQVEWVEAPEARTNWADVLQPLMKNPGKWAIVARKDTPDKAYVTASNLRNGRISSVPPGSWKFRGEKTPDGAGIVKAVYSG